MRKRKYADGVPQHTYAKGINGFFIFYDVMDNIFFITLYFCLSKKHGIRTTAFCIMPNHLHSQQWARARALFIAFNRDLLSFFARGYNRWHHRSGALFEPFGSVPKLVGKTIRNNISYINNNGTVGGLSVDVLGYKWNLLSCYKAATRKDDESSFSKAYKKARKAVNFYNRHCIPLTYEVQERLYANLSPNEKNGLIEYILLKYKVVDFEEMIRYYGSFDEAVLAMNANCGSEPEIQEDYEDYSIYREMIRIVKSKGIETTHLNFETMDSGTLAELAAELSKIPGVKPKQIRKFLHLKKTDK